MKLLVIVEHGKKKTIKYKKEDLLSKSVLDILEEHGIRDIHPKDIEIGEDKIVVNTGVVQVIKVDESDILTKSLTAVVKDKLKLKSTRGIKISIKSCEGK